MQEFYLIYVDESYDAQYFVYSALCIPASKWNKVFDEIVRYRELMKTKYSIPMDYELHATDLVAGRGQPEFNRQKTFRAEIFSSVFDLLKALADINIFTGVTNNKKEHGALFGNLIERIDGFLLENNAYGTLICDEGNEARLISLVRRQRKSVNSEDIFIAEVGDVHTRHLTYNFKDRIIEDPLFKTSKSSYLIQLADLIAFASLKKLSNGNKTEKLVKEAITKLKITEVRN